jgi:peptide/nickel transport system permease protein
MSESTAPPNSASEQGRTLIERLKDNDLLASFLSSKVTVAAGVVTIILFLAALLAPWIAPTDPFNPATNYLSDSLDPPSFCRGDRALSTMIRRDLVGVLYGPRLAAIGFCSGARRLHRRLLGSSRICRRLDGLVIMRIADVQLTFPAILIALLLTASRTRC